MLVRGGRGIELAQDRVSEAGRMLIALSPKRLLGLFSLSGLATFFRARPESSLVRAARKGDKDAFQELMQIYAEPLRRFVSRWVPTVDLDDVLQEAWVSIWQSLPTVDGELKFRQWAFSICYHKVHDYWRREHTRNSNGIMPLRDSQRAYVPKEFEQIELRDTIEGFWKSCTQEQREVLAMVYGDGFTLKEASEVLGRNLNTVKYQFYRAHELAAEKLPDLNGCLRGLKK